MLAGVNGMSSGEKEGDGLGGRSYPSLEVRGRMKDF